jgi:hypothetical protein
MTTVTDDFNRANGALGAAWTYDTGSSAWNVGSNKAARGSSGSDFAYHNTSTGSADCYAEADLDLFITPVFVGVNARISGTLGQNLYMAFLVPGTNQAKIGKIVGGSYSDVNVATFSHGNTHKLRLECQGTTQRLYVDGALVLTTTDSSITTGNLVGFNGQANSTVDNFVGGSLTTSTTLVVADGAHTQTADNVTLTGLPFTVNDAAHAHSADNVTLTLPSSGITDNFNRANGAPGGSWVQTATDYTIVSNKLARSGVSSGNDFIYWNADTGSADMYTEADVTGANSVYVQVVTRFNGNLTNRYLIQAFLTPGSNTASIGYQEAGLYTVINSTSFTHGDAHKLRLESQGTTHRLYVDGALVLTATGGSLAGSSQKGGLTASNTTGSPTFDNFATGSLVTSTTLAVADASHAHVADNVTLTVAGSTTLVVANGAHAHAADNLTLTLASGGGASIFDNFNRADSTMGDSGGVGLGPNWQGGHWHIVSNTARPADHIQWDYWLAALPSDDMFAEATLRPANTTYMGLSLRNPGTSTDAYIGKVNPPSRGDGFQIVKIFASSGVEVPLATNAVAHADTVRLRVEIKGNTIRLYADGVLQLTYVDAAAGPTGRRVGVWAESIGGGGPAIYDDFAAGTLGTVLKDASALYIGTVAATKAYVGTVQVWP